MKCNVCGAEIEDKWSFCPFCGFRKAHEFNKGFEDVLDVFERSFRGIFGANFPDFPFGRGFLVEISREGGAPKVSIKEFDDLKEDRGKSDLGQAIPEGSEVVEPKIVAKENIMEIHIPEVKSEKDVYIRRLGNSLEIKAFSDKKVYFAILPNIKASSIDQRFEDGILTLKFL